MEDDQKWEPARDALPSLGGRQQGLGHVEQAFGNCGMQERGGLCPSRPPVCVSKRVGGSHTGTGMENQTPVGNQFKRSGSGGHKIHEACDYVYSFHQKKFLAQCLAKIWCSVSFY